MKVDVHQHLWSEPLIAALQAREELPFVRRENGLTVLFLNGERHCVIDVDAERPAARAELIERDGLDRALVCLSSPLGIESLPYAQSQPLLAAYHDGAFALDDRFGVWGAVALDRPDEADVDRLLDRGCVGVSMPAGALAGIDALTRVRPLLDRLQDTDAPLFLHPGPGPLTRPATQAVGEPSLADPLWWSALTRYVAEMHAAWLTFASVGRAEYPRLRVIFSMLAGLAPLQAERLSSRGGPTLLRDDPLTFYETSSYGPDSTRRISDVVGAEQLLYGSDRPVVDPNEHGAPSERDWAVIADTTRRVFGQRLAEPAVIGVGVQTHAAGRSDDVSVEPHIVRVAAAPRSGALVR